MHQKQVCLDWVVVAKVSHGWVGVTLKGYLFWNGTSFNDVVGKLKYSWLWKLKANNDRLCFKSNHHQWKFYLRFYWYIFLCVCCIYEFDLFILVSVDLVCFFLFVWFSHSLRVFSQLPKCLFLKLSWEHSLPALSSPDGYAP